MRHWLERGGRQRCLLVFDNATDPAVLRPYLPAAGAARVIITSNERSMDELGTSVLLEVFTENEALRFLAERTSSDDVKGARLVAAELGCLPLALAQAAAVIRSQRLRYATYLERLRALPVANYLTRQDGQPYPYGVAEAVLLSLQAVQDRYQSGMCTTVMDLLSVLSAGGVRRDLLHVAGQVGALSNGTSLSPAVVDEALGRLMEWSLLAFTVDGQAVLAHRLVLRIVRERLAQHGRLAAICQGAASVLDTHSNALNGSVDRLALRDVPEQVAALQQTAAGLPDGTGELGAALLKLRFWALYHLIELGDSAAQAIAVGESLVEDQERVLGPGHPRDSGLP